MKIIINKFQGTWKSDVEPDYGFATKMNQEILLFGKPLLFDTKAFTVNAVDGVNLITDLIPRLTGPYFCLGINNDKVENFAVDFYGHTRLYMHETSGEVILCDQIFELVEDGYSPTYDYYQIIHFLLKGYTWNEGTFFDDIKILSPSKCYEFKDGVIGSRHLSIANYDFNKLELDKVTGAVMQGLFEANHYEIMNLMFSGGKDSTFLAMLLKEYGIKFKAIFSKNLNPRLSLNLEDAFISSRVSENAQFDFQEIELDVSSSLQKSFYDIIEKLPFDFHISISQKNLIEHSKNEFCKMILTGQNADSLYNYGCTSSYPLIRAIVKMFLGIIRREEYFMYVNRYYQSPRVLSMIYKGKADWLTRYLWRKFNPKDDLSTEKLLSGFIFSNSDIPISSWKEMEEITTPKGATSFYERNKREIQNLLLLVEDGTVKNLRELMLRTKLLGHCQGRDVRCITEWSKTNHIDNCQVYSSAPVFTYLSQVRLSIKDIIVPKYHIYKYIAKRINYKKLEKKMYKTDLGEVDCSNEKEYFTLLFKSLDIKQIEQYVEYAIKIINNSSMIDSNKIYEKLRNDLVFKLKLAWLGVTLSKLH